MKPGGGITRTEGGHVFTQSGPIAVPESRPVSSSINEPMSKQDKAVCLDARLIFVMQKLLIILL